MYYQLRKSSFLRELIIFCVVLLSSLCAPYSYSQSTVIGDHVTVSWLAPETFSGSRSETIGFYFEVDPGWHVYWRNSGDSGAAPKFDVIAQNAQVSDILWPYPQRLPVEHLTNLGYEGNTAYLIDVLPVAEATVLEIYAELEWLVCKIDCIPGFGTLSLTRPVTVESVWPEQLLDLRDQFRTRVPKAGNQWRADSLSADKHGDKLQLVLASSAIENNRTAPDVYPIDGDLLSAARPASSTGNNTISYSFSVTPGAQRRESTSFVVVDGNSAWLLDSIDIDYGSNANKSTIDTVVESPLWLLLLSSFVGGLLLNLMPCVFPVLSIKTLALVTHSRGERMRETLLYVLGVVATFSLLGALLLFLRAGGAAVGWGFQLQSPSTVLLLILLFWLMALSFSGLFEFGHRLMSLAGSTRGGSFCTGVLAVFVAAPCTGPFMGSALGAAAILPPISAMLIFVSLGVGLACPFVILCANPGLLKRLPKPGPWMNTLRQFLAFPLYATVIWLMWVLGRLTGEEGWVISAFLLLLVTLALWLRQNMKPAGRASVSVIATGIVIYAFTQLNSGDADGSIPTATNMWQSFDQNKIEDALEEGRGVFIDYTAAWCITCQINKKTVLNTSIVQELFSRHNVLSIRADWTNRNPEITRSLADLGRNSVPVYAWYPPGSRQPRVLPQILQQHMITTLFSDSSNNPQSEDLL